MCTLGLESVSLLTHFSSKIGGRERRLLVFGGIEIQLRIISYLKGIAQVRFYEVHIYILCITLSGWQPVHPHFEETDATEAKQCTLVDGGCSETCFRQLKENT